MIDLFSLTIIGCLLTLLIFVRGLRIPHAVVMSVILIVPILNAFADSLTNLVTLGGINIGGIRAIFLIFVFIFLTSGQMNRHLSSISIFVFLLYVYLLLWFSSDISNSVDTYLKILISMLALPFALRYIRTLPAIKALSASTILAMVVIIGQLILAQIFKWGPSGYADDSFYQGGAGIQVSYTLALGILLTPLFMELFKGRGQRLMIVVITILSLITVILLARRIALIALTLSFLLFMLFYRRSSRVVVTALVVIAITLIIWPFIAPTVDARMGNRFVRLTPEGIQTEGRFIETLVLLEEIENQPLINILFGNEALNSAGYFRENWNRYLLIVENAASLEGRQFHVDYNRLLFGTGVVGLLLYLILNILIGWHFKRSYERLDDVYKPRIIWAMFWSVFVYGLIVSISGSLTVLGYRFLLFCWLGAMSGIVDELALRTKHRQEDLESIAAISS